MTATPTADASAPPPEVVPVCASDGHATAFREHRAATRQAPAIVFLPAMGVRASYYDPFGAALAAAGLHAAVPDLRGLGESSVRASRRCDFGFRELVEVDLPATVAAVRARIPDGRPLLLGGHSLGGLLATLGVAVVEPEPDAVLTVASGAAYYHALGLRRRAAFLAAVVVMRALAVAVGHFPGRWVGFGEREPRRLIREWIRVQLADRLVFEGSAIDYEARLRASRVRALSLAFTDDAWAPPRYVGRLAARLGGAVALERTPPAELGAEALGHFGWVRAAAGPIARRVAAFAREPQPR